jgi:hypothetical protein
MRIVVILAGAAAAAIAYTLLISPGVSRFDGPLLGSETDGTSARTNVTEGEIELTRPTARGLPRDAGAEANAQPQMTAVRSSDPALTRLTVVDPLLVKNITQRQAAIREHMACIDDPKASDRERSGALQAISALSVLAMHDIEGRSLVVPEMAVDLEEASRDPQKYRIRFKPPAVSDPGVRRITSGAAVYDLRPGEFPEYDLVEVAKRTYAGGSVPLGELPRTEILARARQVLSYKVQ